MPPLTGSDLRKAAKRFKKRKSYFDFQVTWFASLPDEHLDMLAVLLFCHRADWKVIPLS